MQQSGDISEKSQGAGEKIQKKVNGAPRTQVLTAS
jgi:hypothetical protein